ncbi:glutamate-cysteine ligase family protein [Candidatus Pelagibacter sp.]|nr:glutamate-cysteine ligase family protein [Candidatus Pelagibacter sp.]
MISKNDFISYFKTGIKNDNECGIGIEHEKFIFNNNKRINYKSVLLLFTKLYEFGWKPIIENENVIALKKGSKNITLEPGNQIELSGEKLKNIHQTCSESQEYIFELSQSLKKLDFNIISSGFDPVSKIEEVPSNPKNRYELMTKIMPLFGKLSLDMMYRTCGTQINIDYISEEDFSKKFFVVNRLSPITIALFANSGIVEKNKSGYLSYRSHVWQNTYRGGLPKIFLEKMTFEKYADFILNYPMLFIKRNDKYLDTKNKTFQNFLDGEIENVFPNEDDIGDHLSTIFTENRLKKYIEIRSMDACGWDCLCAGPAFFIGLLYGNLDEVFDLVKRWNINDITSAYKDAPKNGLKTILGNKSILRWSKNLLDISTRGLQNRNELNSKKQNEVKFLNHIKTIINSNSTNAEEIITKYLKDKNFFTIHEK